MCSWYLFHNVCLRRRIQIPIQYTICRRVYCSCGRTSRIFTSIFGQAFLPSFSRVSFFFGHGQHMFYLCNRILLFIIGRNTIIIIIIVIMQIFPLNVIYLIIRFLRWCISCFKPHSWISIIYNNLCVLNIIVTWCGLFFVFILLYVLNASHCT